MDHQSRTAVSEKRTPPRCRPKRGPTAAEARVLAKHHHHLVGLAATQSSFSRSNLASAIRDDSTIRVDSGQRQPTANVSSEAWRRSLPANASGQLGTCGAPNDAQSLTRDLHRCPRLRNPPIAHFRRSIREGTPGYLGLRAWSLGVLEFVLGAAPDGLIIFPSRECGTNIGGELPTASDNRRSDTLLESERLAFRSSTWTRRKASTTDGSSWVPEICSKTDIAFS